jgi:hypothetical protein
MRQWVSFAWRIYVAENTDYLGDDVKLFIIFTSHKWAAHYLPLYKYELVPKT